MAMRLVLLLMRASLLVSPRLGTLLVRRAFAAGGAKTKAALDRHAPAGVAASLDERYGDEPDMLLDVFRPESADGSLPLVVWIHGGGFVAGAKEELAGWFKLIASHGYVVAAPRYSLAPRHRYPTPLRQVTQALARLQSRPELDAQRIVLAGDSAGAHIAAQVSALVTTPGYAAQVGVEPTIAREQLRGVVLCCGPYDLALARHTSPAGRDLVRILLWAYSGTRDYLDDPAFAHWSITDHVTPAFPPALVTVGDGDPLRPHSERLVECLRAQGVVVEAFFPAHDPPLPHEYQFDLDGEPGRRFLERLVAFLQRSVASSA
jgi:acetyl esterase